jgi:hypothetical protein
MDNPEKLGTLGTQDTRRRPSKQKKHNTTYVEHNYAQTNTNNVNKTWSLLYNEMTIQKYSVYPCAFHWASIMSSSKPNDKPCIRCGPIIQCDL